ncbi:MAG TPA: RING finger protein [Leptolinea sp.]
MNVQNLEPRMFSPVSFPTPLPRKRLARKSYRSIRLVGKEELRCPYCLQLIDRKEQKSMVVCPICQSAHHKECWDITGSCQVPHNHAVL